MSTRKYNFDSSFEMKGLHRNHSGQSIDEYHRWDDCLRNRFDSEAYRRPLRQRWGAKVCDTGSFGQSTSEESRNCQSYGYWVGTPQHNISSDSTVGDTLISYVQWVYNSKKSYFISRSLQAYQTCKYLPGIILQEMIKCNDSLIEYFFKILVNKRRPCSHGGWVRANQWFGLRRDRSCRLKCRVSPSCVLGLNKSINFW